MVLKRVIYLLARLDHRRTTWSGLGYSKGRHRAVHTMKDLYIRKGKMPLHRRLCLHPRWMIMMVEVTMKGYAATMKEIGSQCAKRNETACMIMSYDGRQVPDAGR